MKLTHVLNPIKWLKKEEKKDFLWTFKELLFKKIHHQRRLIYLFCVLVFLYLWILVFAKDIETLATFPGMKYEWRNTSDIPLKYETIRFISDNVTVAWIYIDTQSEKTIYYFHGNGGPLPYFFSDLQYLSSLGYNVAALEYPGYAQLPWKPYEETLRKASDAFFRHLQRSRNLKEEDTIVWGYSIWTAVGLNWAAWKNIHSIVLVSPLSSRFDMSKVRFWFPLQKLFFLPNSFESSKHIELIQSPLLVFHGNDDMVIPFTQWKKVWKNSVSDHKYFIEIDGWNHASPLGYWWDLLKSDIEKFLKTWELQQRYYFYDAIERFNLQIKNKVFSLDLDSDSSKTKYINNQIHFANPYHIPDELVPLKWDYVVASNWWMLLQKEALWFLNVMAKDFYDVFHRKLHIVSGYRSYDYQEGIKERGCPDALCAKAGHSEHQSGLAIDLFEASSEGAFLAKKDNQNYFAWLKENAHLYGYHNTYQKWLEVDGYMVEPWHWRYVGVELATYLKENNLTLAEFYNKIKNK